MSLVLAACGHTDAVTSEKYITKAPDIVSLLNDANYKDVHTTFDDTIEVGLLEEAMKELAPIFEEKDGHYIVVLAAK